MSSPSNLNCLPLPLHGGDPIISGAERSRAPFDPSRPADSDHRICSFATGVRSWAQTERLLMNAC